MLHIDSHTQYDAPKKYGGVCMKGSIYTQSDRWIVGWWYQGKQWKITRYKGQILYRTHPEKERCYGYKSAQKCLSLMQNRYEESLKGLCAFRIEEFSGKGWTDVIEFYKKWLREVIEPNRKPATIKGYRSYLRNWIEPFFQINPVMLHEIQLDTLIKLMNYIKLSGKGKSNVMMAFHACLDYAWRSKRIPEIPPFPKKKEYGIVEPTIRWLIEDRQMAIIDAIPEIHRPIFLWLKYHLRRPSEACALHKEDYDIFQNVFIIRRAISARRVVNNTKTNVEHVIPCHSSFTDIAKTLLKQNPSRFFFTNPRARRVGRRYTNESLNNIWKKACRIVGENIDLYSGLKHSSCSQFINERGLSISDLQEITDHARLDSVRKYAKVEVALKRALMETTKRLPNLKIVGNKE
jgi:integrase